MTLLDEVDEIYELIKQINKTLKKIKNAGKEENNAECSDADHSQAI